MSADVRRMLAEKLEHQMKRWDIDVMWLANETGLSEEIIVGYLQANRELSIPEVQSILIATGLNVFKVFSKDYEPSSLFVLCKGEGNG